MALTDPLDPHDPMQRQTHARHWSLLLGAVKPDRLVARVQESGVPLQEAGSLGVGRAVRVLELLPELAIVVVGPLDGGLAQVISSYPVLLEGSTLQAVILQMRPWANGFDSRVDVAVDGQRQSSHQRTFFSADGWADPGAYRPGNRRPLAVGGFIDRAHVVESAPGPSETAIVPLWQLLNSSNPADEVQFLAPVVRARELLLPMDQSQGGPEMGGWLVHVSLGALGEVPLFGRAEHLRGIPRPGAGLFGTAWLQCRAGPAALQSAELAGRQPGNIAKP